MVAMPPPPKYPPNGANSPKVAAIIVIVIVLAFVCAVSAFIGYEIGKRHTETVTPQACVRALDIASQAFALSGKAVTALGNLQAATAINYTDQLNALKPSLAANASACRASAST